MGVSNALSGGREVGRGVANPSGGATPLPFPGRLHGAAGHCKTRSEAEKAMVHGVRLAWGVAAAAPPATVTVAPAAARVRTLAAALAAGAAFFGGSSSLSSSLSSSSSESSDDSSFLAGAYTEGGGHATAK